MANQATPGERPPSAAQAPVILCGLGRVGLEILCLLRRLGESVTAITLPSRESVTPEAADDHIHVIAGDARDEALLARAGIARAKALIAATDNDLVNVTIALHARQVAPSLPVVVRLFDQELGAQLRTALGIRQGYSASALAAPAFVAAAQGDKVAASFELAGEDWFVERLTMANGSAWVGRSVGSLVTEGTVVLALDRGEGLSVEPGAEHALAAGDCLTTLARHDQRPPARSRLFHRLARGLQAARAFWKSTPRGLRFACYGLLAVVLVSVGVFQSALGLSPVDAYYFVITTLTTTGYGDFSLQKASPLVKVYGTLVMVSGGALFAVLFSMMTDLLLRTRFVDVMAQGSSHRRDHVIVAGLGNTGFRVLRQLVRLGEQVVAVENSTEAKFLGPARTLAPTVIGDAGASETLQRAGLAGAKTVVAVTNDDLTNLSIALAAKQARPECRVVARVFDQALAARMQRTLGIDSVVSVSEAVAPTFIGSVLDPEVIRGVVVRDHLLLFALRTAGERAGPEPGTRTLLVQGADGKYRPAAQPPAQGARTLVARFIPLAK